MWFVSSRAKALIKLYYRLYLPGPQHFFRNSNRAMATGWSFTRTLFPPLTRHPVYSATVCCAVFSPPYSHLILVQSSSAHPARTPHALRFLSRWERRMKRARPWEVTIEEEAAAWWTRGGRSLIPSRRA